MGRVRVVLAGLLALVYPGLGHAYLREWLRALSWFGLALLTAALVVPASVVTAYQQGGLTQLVAATQQLPTAALGALLLVRVLNVVDAVRLALLAPRGAGLEAGRCPHCGGPVDPELDFCYWCTAQLKPSSDRGSGPTNDNLL